MLVLTPRFIVSKILNYKAVKSVPLGKCYKGADVVMDTTTWIILGCVVVGFLFFKIWIPISEQKNFKQKVEEDERKNYDEVELYKIEKNGHDYLVSNYKDYEKNKERSLNNLFRPGAIIKWQGVNWEVISTPQFEVEGEENASILEKNTNYIFVKVRYISELDKKENSVINYGNYSQINNSTIDGSNFKFQNDYTIYDLLISEIDKFIQEPTNNESITQLKYDLSSLKESLMNREKITPKKTLVNRLGDIAKTASPFASLAGAILNIISKI